MSSLEVPVSVAGLFLAKEQRMVGPRLDFTRLPWSDGKHDHNTTTPFLAAAVEAEPFSDHSQWLEPGIHLHWALPDGLTRGSTMRSVVNQIDIDGLFMPQAPNRWLIMREEMGEGQSVDRSWLIESDYVHPPGLKPTGATTPYPKKNWNGKGPSFAYVGRQMLLSQAGVPDSAQANLFDPKQRLTTIGPALTSLGHGDPMFATHYPSCRSIFGFHDEDPGFNSDPEGTGAFSRVYHVLGWYGDPMDDPLGRFVTANHTNTQLLRAVAVNGGFDPDSTDTTPAEADTRAMSVLIGERFGWATEHMATGSMPSALYCRGAIVVSSIHGLEKQALETTEFAMGESPAEAFAAYARHNSPLAWTLGDNIDDATIVQGLTQADLSESGQDLPAKMAEARHEIQFVAHRGHKTWIIRPAENQQSAGQRKPVLPPELAEHLNELCAAQAEYDRQCDVADGMRQQVFNFWSHYLNVLTPEHEMAPLSEDVNALRTALDRQYLQPLESILRNKGELFIGTSALGRVVAQDAAQIAAAGSKLYGPLIGATGTLTRDVSPRLGSIRGFDVRAGLIIDDLIPVYDEGIPVRDRRRGGNLRQVRFAPGEELVGVSGETGTFSGQSVLSTLWLETTFGRHIGPFSWSPAGSGTSFKVEVPEGMMAAGFDNYAIVFMSGLQLLVLPKGEHYSGADGRLTQAGEVVEKLAELQAEINLHNSEGMALTIRQAPGPRYYTPHDPVVVLHGWDSRPSTRHGHDGVDQNNNLLQSTIVYLDEWDHKTQAIPVGLVNQVTSTQAPFHLSKNQGWHPIELEWQAELETLREGANRPEPIYNPAFVQTHETLYDSAVDLAPADDEAGLDGGYEYISGRSILNASAGRKLMQRLFDFSQTMQLPGVDRSDFMFAPTVVPLGGFHSKLGMQDPVPQLPIADPLALTAGQIISVRVRDALGSFHPTSPRPTATFHPIRSGEMLLHKLRVIDTFGRSRETRPEQLNKPRRLEPRSGGVDRIRLPMRLSQPARLSFRWLSSAHNNAESALHPAASPVCGWVLADHLDGAVDVYDHAGILLGRVDDQAKWQSAPGDPSAPRSSREIQHVALARLVDWLLAPADPQHISAFLKTLDAGLAKVDPRDAQTHQARALLMSRPVALVRARLSLESQHPLSEDQSLEAVRARLQGKDPQTHNVGHVRFPVRLGEHHHLTDGLCGYWHRPQPGAPLETMFTAPRLQGASENAYIKMPTPDQPATQLSLALEQPPHDITMLIEPHAQVHATTGILPVKAISLPPEFYRDQIEQLRVTFRVGPILMPHKRYEAPLPVEPGFSWSWLELVGSTWTMIPHHPLVQRADVMAVYGLKGSAVWDYLLASGQIRIENVDGPIASGAEISEGYLMQPALNMPTKGLVDLELTQTDINRTLHAIANGIDRTVETARLDTRIVARSGWLQLRQDIQAESSEENDDNPNPGVLT